MVNVTAFGAAVLLLLTACAAAQTFDAASVKPSPESMRPSMPRIGPESLSVRAATLKYCVMTAYDVEEYQVAGAAGWMENERYDIDGRSENAVSPSDIRLMLRSLLAERFQLKAHTETRPVAMTVLAVAKGGPKFGPAFHILKDGDPPPDLGKFSGTHLAYPGITIKDFLNRLRVMLGRDPATGAWGQAVLPLLDETGLGGRYAIALNTDTADTWSAMLEQQLGLKLEDRKVPKEIVVIDGAVKPSAN